VTIRHTDETPRPKQQLVDITGYISFLPKIRDITRLISARGQKASLVPSCSNLRSFGRKRTILKKILATLLGIFGAPIVIRLRGTVPPSLCPCQKCKPIYVSLYQEEIHYCSAHKWSTETVYYPEP